MRQSLEYWFLFSQFFSLFCLEGSWVQPQGPNFPSPWATMLALRLDCSTSALTTPQKVLLFWKLVELKMLDFSDCMRTGISILTSAADHQIWSFNRHYRTGSIFGASQFYSVFLTAKAEANSPTHISLLYLGNRECLFPRNRFLGRRVLSGFFCLVR